MAHDKTEITYKVRHDMPGADDNASGVASLLELSRLLKERASKLDKQIDLVAFTLEEPPNFATNNMGSAHHAESVKDDVKKIKGMIALDMVGYFKDEKDSQKYPLPIFKWFHGDKGNFIGVIGNLPAWGWIQQVKHTMGRNTALPVKWLSAPDFIPGVDFSDHRNYSRLGIPSVMISDLAFYRNPHYHQHTDKPETLDYKRMGQVVEGLLGTLINI
ncbi:MAG: M28 family peptidase [Vampirovibrionales bacterium]|nr:M28 family peptidase [Vampirovibrionales bacterium]